MGLGPSPVIRVRGSNPSPARRRPRPGALAAVKLAAAWTFNGRVLAGCSLAGFSQTPASPPIRVKTSCMACFSKRRKLF